MRKCKGALVSIIVPVYQVREYINDCVESLIRQTYTNLEILMIDDGSTDGSGEICDTYANKDDRIRVIHQDNQGLSAARNTGLNQVKGDYIVFVDSDDVVRPDYVEKLYSMMHRYQADIAACAYIRVAAKGLGSVDDILDNLPEKAVCMTSEQMLRQWHGKYKKWETVVWNKMYRRKVLGGANGMNEIRFPIGRRHEDVLTSHLIVANAERIVLTTRKLYLYRIRSDSITTGRITKEYRKQNLLAQRERMAFFREKRYWRAYLNLLAGYVLHMGWFTWKRVKTQS